MVYGVFTMVSDSFSLCFSSYCVKISRSRSDSNFSAIAGTDCLIISVRTVTDNGTGDTGGGAVLTPFFEAKQAAKYAELMSVYCDNADIIDRVTFWGYSDGSSWRSALFPLMFNADLSPKQSFYAILNTKSFR